MRPSAPSTQTSACVVSVSTLAKSSPRTKSVLTSDVEECRFVSLDREPRRADVRGGELAQAVACLGARLQRLLVRPQRDHECLRAGLVGQPNQAAVAGAVT